MTAATIFFYVWMLGAAAGDVAATSGSAGPPALPAIATGAEPRFAMSGLRQVASMVAALVLMAAGA